MTQKIKLLLIIGILWWSGGAMAQTKSYTISGSIKDASNGEDLIGANIRIKGTEYGTVANVYGFYSISIPAGTYTVEYSFIGYETLAKEVVLEADQRIDISLLVGQKQLEEVLISGQKENYNVTSTEIGIKRLDIQTVLKVPSFAGEIDVIKTIQFLPGVSTVGEGASGFNVRGGSVGQNLVLLDEAPVYNASHLFGFFSVFNPDAVKDLKLYKSAIPPRFGGRISSILDIKMKEGNNQKFQVNGGIGTIFSRLAIEGPFKKNKGSFIIAGRRSYIDALIKPFTDILDGGAELYFYDLTLKTNYQINENNRIFLSGYFGRDVFMFSANQGFSWGNTTATLRWNHLFSKKIFSNFSFFYSNYDYSLAFVQNEENQFTWKSDISTINFKPEFTYFVNANNEISFGAELIFYIFNPANAVGISNGEKSDISLPKKNSIESSFYIGNQQKITSKFSLDYGIRLSTYYYIGAATVYDFQYFRKGYSKIPSVVKEAAAGELIQSYWNPEPRISFTYAFNKEQSIKGSYNRTAQYIHLISNTVASNPLDVWTQSTNNIKPQTGDQFVLGYFRNFKKNIYEASVEVYYRTTTNQLDYVSGVNLLINRYLEGAVLPGIGRAYGIEWYFQKKEGKFNGWVSYTLGRTELKIDDINNGTWYPTRYDQTHNLKITTFYDINSQWSLSANFTYITGTPTTLPTSRYQFQNITVPYNYSNSRNNTRIPDYHRLDIGATWNSKPIKPNGQPRKINHQVVLSIYNLYGRRNPFSIYTSQGTMRQLVGPAQTYAYQFAVIGSVVPGISYNFKF